MVLTLRIRKPAPYRPIMNSKERLLVAKQLLQEAIAEMGAPVQNDSLVQAIVDRSDPEHKAPALLRAATEAQIFYLLNRPNTKERLRVNKLAKELLGKAMIEMIEQKWIIGPPPGDNMLARTVVDFLDPNCKAPDLLRVEAEAQIAYHLHRSTWRLERGILDWLRS